MDFPFGSSQDRRSGCDAEAKFLRWDLHRIRYRHDGLLRPEDECVQARPPSGNLDEVEAVLCVCPTFDGDFHEDGIVLHGGEVSPHRIGYVRIAKNGLLTHDCIVDGTSYRITDYLRFWIVWCIPTANQDAEGECEDDGQKICRIFLHLVWLKGPGG